ncbi:MAG: DHH family phosphoesterase, partial [Firmicutes bacterium]|nr:DHH family phosphoesterase [Bacillota bacterium]
APEDALFLLDPRPERLYGPRLMADMDRAVERLRRAVGRGERVLVYGDYDCDGITGTALLVRVLRALGCRVEYYIPHRVEEGYGLNREALDWAAARGVTLVVTVDCGIQAAELVARAGEAGMDIIVTDHHEIAGPLPEAAAVVNPRRPDCQYPFKELAGVGVAYKLAQALTGDSGGPDPVCLALVCLGTVADQVPLTGEITSWSAWGSRNCAGPKSPV